MNPLLLQALITTLGVFAGATVTAFTTYISSRLRIKELELENEHKKQGDELANQWKKEEEDRVNQRKEKERQLAAARLHIKTLYTPINIRLSNIIRSFLRVDFATDDKKDFNQEEVQIELRDAVRFLLRAFSQYNKEVSNLYQTGKDVYLKSDIEQNIMRLDVCIHKVEEFRRRYIPFLEYTNAQDMPKKLERFSSIFKHDKTLIEIRAVAIETKDLIHEITDYVSNKNQE